MIHFLLAQSCDTWCHDIIIMNARLCQMNEDQEMKITAEQTPILTSCGGFPLQADANCPLHPATNDLPSPIPQGVTDALDYVENYLSSLLNSTTLVSQCSSGLITHHRVCI